METLNSSEIYGILWAGLTAGAAGYAVMTRNLLRCGISLVIQTLGMAALIVALEAEFVAAAAVITGGIMAVTLLSFNGLIWERPVPNLRRNRRRLALRAVAGVGVLTLMGSIGVILLPVIAKSSQLSPGGVSFRSIVLVEALGARFLGGDIVVFELMGLTLLSGLVGVSFLLGRAKNAD